MIAFLDRLRFGWSQLTARPLWPFIAVVCAGTAVAAGLIFIPAVWNPYVRVPGTSFSVALDCIPSTVQIHTISPLAQLRTAKIGVEDVLAHNATYFPLKGQPVSVGGERVFVLDLAQEEQASASRVFSAGAARARASLNVEFTPSPHIDIRSVSIVPSSGQGNVPCVASIPASKELASRVSPRATYMWYTLLQERLSDGIWLSNQFIGNIVLAAMVVWSCWLVSLLVVSVKNAFFEPDEALRSLYEGKLAGVHLELRNKGAQAVVSALHAQDQRSLALARVLGPALGFLLTVSSLVAGLHPAEQATRDTFQFMSSLQIALVATFFGLMIRVLAELVLRYARHAAYRMIAIEATVSHDDNKK